MKKYKAFRGYFIDARKFPKGQRSAPSNGPLIQWSLEYKIWGG